MGVPDMIRALERRIADQRKNGGDLMTYGMPDPLDMALLTHLKKAIVA